MELDRIIRMPELEAITGLSSATIYRKMAEGTFPRSVQLGRNSVGWRASAVQTWNESLEDAGPEPDPAAPATSHRGRARALPPEESNEHQRSVVEGAKR